MAKSKHNRTGCKCMDAFYLRSLSRALFPGRSWRSIYGKSNASKDLVNPMFCFEGNENFRCNKKLLQLHNLCCLGHRCCSFALVPGAFDCFIGSADEFEMFDSVLASCSRCLSVQRPVRMCRLRLKTPPTGLRHRVSTLTPSAPSSQLAE